MPDSESLEGIINKLKSVQYTENNFSRIMKAQTVKELLDFHFNPEELIPLFHAAEELARFEESNILYCDSIAQKAKKARPVKKRRAFFI